MAKDRNSTTGKPVGSKATKAEGNRGKRSTAATSAATSRLQARGSSERQLSDGEISILAVFRKYLMTPGRMLCLNNTDIGTMKRSLDKLTAAGLLIPEDFKGSYSLTRSGFKAMNELG
ncbi:MAG: hypothetical protein KDA45_05615 [Planctomycetales bacterium]|nr:hypothetical protein [Planctomycetales bacterium]